MKLDGLRGLLAGSNYRTEYFDHLRSEYERASMLLNRTKKNDPEYNELKHGKEHWFDMFTGYIVGLIDIKLITDEQGNALIDELTAMGKM